MWVGGVWYYGVWMFYYVCGGEYVGVVDVLYELFDVVVCWVY